MLSKSLMALVAITCIGPSGFAQNSGQAQNLYYYGTPAAVFQSKSKPNSEALRAYEVIQNKVNEAKSNLKNADNSEDRAEARDALAAALAEDYDARLDQYEAEIKRMEEELKAMRKKLDRRRSAKAEMIQLRMQLLEAEADDLGWPAPVAQGKSPSSARYFYGTPSRGWSTGSKPRVVPTPATIEPKKQ